MMIKRKLAYLVEKVTWYENTINYYFRPMKDMKYVNGKWEKLELPSYALNNGYNQSAVDYSSKIYKQFIESKTEGFFAEITNFNLHNLLMKNFPKYAEDFKTYEQTIRQTPGTDRNTIHPMQNIYQYDWPNYVRVMMLILNHAGYELMDNININRTDLYGKDGVQDRKTVILKIAKTNVNYKYEVLDYQNIEVNINNVYYMIYDAHNIIQIKKSKVN